MRKSRFLTGIALLALTVSGCGMTADSNGRKVVVPAEPTMIDFVDPASVAGLSTRTMSDGYSSDSRYVHISVPDLPQAPNLNKALQAEAKRQVSDFRIRTRGHAAQAPVPELNVDWQLTAVSPQAIGVRLRTGEFIGQWSNSTRTYWFDPYTNKAVTSIGLLSGKNALARVAALAIEQLKERGSQVEQNGPQAGGGAYDSMTFNRNGDLIVEFDDCQIGSCSLGRLAVALPAQKVTPLLSPLGRQAQASVRQAARTSMPRSTPEFGPTTRPNSASRRAGKVNCSEVKCVALTFDDGPGPYTARLLDLLQKHWARATFFTVGSNAAAQPALLRRMSMEGQLVENHTWAHRDLSKLSTSRIADAIKRSGDAVSSIIGQTPTLVRPPYGAVNTQVRDVARELNVALVSWDVDTDDLLGGDANDIADRAVHAAHPGAIILMHDTHRESVDAVPDILKRLRGKGYSFVTVPELYGSAGMQAGRLYKSGSERPSKKPLT